MVSRSPWLEDAADLETCSWRVRNRSKPNSWSDWRKITSQPGAAFPPARILCGDAGAGPICRLRRALCTGDAPTAATDPP
ncbi:hypothetical protein GRJ2_002422200 [Grus japonensis]|uniref:Uncharacterized protein n=1 Tax=Grus japonensis TaxID=30415 RepID=A0ABC9XPB9_GRUJA